MPADDHPIDALQRRFDMEDASVSPVASFLSKLLSYSPLPPPFDKITEAFKNKLSNDGAERIKFVLDVLSAETKNNNAVLPGSEKT